VSSFRLVHLGTGLAVASTFACLGLSGERSLAVVTLAAGASYITATLVQLEVFDARPAFQALAIVGASCTALSWLLIPSLRALEESRRAR
jgi:hypothetical protein